MDYQILWTTAFVTFFGVFAYARALHHLLQRFSVESHFLSKELVYSAVLFIPLNIAYFLLLYFEISPIWNFAIFAVFIAGIILPLRFIYKLNWKKTLLLSLLWFLCILVIGFVLNLIVGLILLA